MNWNHGLTGVAIFLAMGLPVLAQMESPEPSGSPTPGGHHRHHHQDLGKALNLSDDQKSQLKDIMKNNPQGPDRAAAINKILTPDQQTKFAQMQSQHKNRGDN